MDDMVWVFRTFGFRIGIQYVFSTIALKIGRLIRREKAKTYGMLSDNDKKRAEFAFRLHDYYEKDDFDKHEKKSYDQLN